MVQFARTDVAVARDMLIVAPLSGHFPFLLRDLVIGLIPSFRVFVTDWINARHVGPEHKVFTLESNIDCVLRMMRCLPPGATVLALCQGGPPALAASAMLASADDARAPANIVLIAAPIDPLAGPTRVVRALRARSLSSMERTLTACVSQGYEGQGRRVYPAEIQLAALWTYLARRISEGSELLGKLLHDDGTDPLYFPFVDAYTSIMDLDAVFFLDNVKSLYQDCELRSGKLRFNGERVDPRAIRKSRMLTIEGELDDIAAPGQTDAAHGLCLSIPASSHRRIVIPRCGHFSLFHGGTWRRAVLPEILGFTGAVATEAMAAG